jgi:rod shape-determining protein MreB
MKDGVIANFEIAKKMIETFIKKTKKKGALTKPRILIGIPWGITAVEKRAVTEAAYCAGAKEAYLIDEPMAAALGANLPVELPLGQLLVDIGGGTTEVAVISLFGIAVCKSIRSAGDAFDSAIISHCKKNYNLLIGENMAEKIKIKIGSATPFNTEKEMTVKGRDLLSGLPQSFTISSYEIRDTLSECIQVIIDTIKSTLTITPPELAGDIIKNGITMTGGGSLLHGLNQYITEKTGLKATVANNPLPCVALGTGKVLENKELFERISMSISR